MILIGLALRPVLWVKIKLDCSETRFAKSTGTHCRKASCLWILTGQTNSQRTLLAKPHQGALFDFGVDMPSPEHSIAI